jgi:hypothetical protein
VSLCLINKLSQIFHPIQPDTFPSYEKEDGALACSNWHPKKLLGNCLARNPDNLFPTESEALWEREGEATFMESD